MFINKQSITHLTQTISLQEHLKKFLEVKRSGGTHGVAKCPFHQDNSPSFYIYQSNYHCFSCKAHGTIIDYEMHRTGLSFKESVEQLAKAYNIALEYEQSANESKLKEQMEFWEIQNRLVEKLHKGFQKQFNEKNLDKNILHPFTLYFKEAGFFSDQEDLMLFLTKNEIEMIKGFSFFNDKSEKEIFPNAHFKNCITLPLYKENGKIIGFSFSKLHPEHEFQIVDSNFSILLTNPIFQPLIHWQEVRPMATKEKCLIITQSIDDAVRFYEKNINHVAINPMDKISINLAKSISKRVSKIILVLPFSTEGKRFLWKTFQESFLVDEISIYVRFFPVETVEKKNIFENSTHDKLMLWLLSADKIIYKITDLVIEKTSALESAQSIFTKTIYPIIQKINDQERKISILNDIFNKYGISEKQNLFTRSLNTNANFGIKADAKSVAPRNLTVGANGIGLNSKMKSQGNMLENQPIINDEKITQDTKKLINIMAKAIDFYHRILLGSKGTMAQKYLEERGIFEQDMKHWKIGFCPNTNELSKKLKSNDQLNRILKYLGLIKESKYNLENYDFFHDRIIIPVYSCDGTPVALAGRITLDVKKTPKYINSPESDLFSKSKILFNFNRAINSIHIKKYVIVVEGYMDCISLVKYGIDNVVAVMGTALSYFHVQALAKLTKRIILCFDNDDAGQNAAARSLISNFSSPEVLIEHVLLPQSKDPDEFIKKFGKDEFLKVLETKNTPLYEKVCYWVAQKSQDQEDLKNNLEKELVSVYPSHKSKFFDEFSHFVFEKYNIDIKKIIMKKVNFQNHEVLLSTISSSNVKKEEIPQWFVTNSVEIKILFAFVYAKLNDLPVRLQNVMINRESENKNAERICALAINNQFSKAGYAVFLEMCAWIVENPSHSLYMLYKSATSQLSAGAQITLSYCVSNAKNLMKYGLEDLLREDLSRPSGVVSSKNIWNTKNSSFLRFHLRHIQLGFQGNILPSLISEALLQLEIDYIDNALKVFSSFHFDNEVDPQFRQLESERARRQEEKDRRH